MNEYSGQTECYHSSHIIMLPLLGSLYHKRNICASEMFENAGAGPGLMGLFNSQYLKPKGM